MNEIKKYLDTVCEQVRFQKAHDILKKELQDHITDQTDSLIEQGFEEEIAVQKAITEMGDPVLVGTELDRVHRPKCEWSFIVFAVMFSLINFAFRIIVKQSVNNIYYDNFIHVGTIFSFVIGIAVMIAICYMDFTILANNAQKIYAIYIIIMAILHIYLKLFGTTVNGSCSYISIAFFYIKSPALIYLFPVILIGLLYDCRGKSYGTILLCGASFLLPAFLTLEKGNNAGIIIIAIVSLLLISISILKGWFAVKKHYALLLFLIPMILIALCIACLCPYFHSRLLTIYNTIQEPFVTTAREILQSNLKSASLFGRGELLHTANGKLVQLPMLLTREYITAYMLYYGGWIIFALFLIVYVLFIAKGFLLTYKQKSQLGSMTALAVLLTFSLLTIWNIAVSSGFFIDFNPLEIPFFSYGGHASIIFFILLGILLSTFRNGNYVLDSTQKNNSLIQIQNGVVTIHLKKKKKRGENT